MAGKYLYDQKNTGVIDFRETNGFTIYFMGKYEVAIEQINSINPPIIYHLWNMSGQADFDAIEKFKMFESRLRLVQKLNYQTLYKIIRICEIDHMSTTRQSIVDQLEKRGSRKIK